MILVKNLDNGGLTMMFLKRHKLLLVIVIFSTILVFANTNIKDLLSFQPCFPW